MIYQVSFAALCFPRSRSDFLTPRVNIQEIRRVHTTTISVYVCQTVCTKVTVTGPPEIVVVVLLQPNTEEQKLVKEAVRVFVLWMALEQDEMEETLQDDTTAQVVSRMAPVTSKMNPKNLIFWLNAASCKM